MSRLANVARIAETGRVERRIFVVRGHKVILDSDLAHLYGVSTKRLNQQVRRNAARFPSDFMLQLTGEEVDNLRSQIVTSSARQRIGFPGKHGGRRYTPLAFTEQGVAMLSSVLRSERAIQVNIAIMRAFVHLRELLATHREFARKLDELERKYDKRFAAVFLAIRRLMMARTDPPRGRIGF